MNGRKKVMSPLRRRMGLISVMALTAAVPTFGQEVCGPVNGATPEKCRPMGEGIASKGFSISFGGGKVAGQERIAIAGESAAGDQLGTDLALRAVNVQVRYDAISEDRRLNILTSDLRTEFRGGDTIRFRASNNYGRWIKRAELRITPVAADGETVIQPMAADGTLDWVMPEGDQADYSFVLRVYDSQGRFDETVPARISRRARPTMPALNGRPTAAGEGEDRTGRRTIPVFGGMVTVGGEDLPRGTTVLVMGRAVPVDPEGRFVTDLVLPPGVQNVSVSLATPGQQGVTLTRQIDIPRSDWFGTGLADLTIGRRSTSSLDEGYARGRLAFYAKGVLQDGTRVTSAFDSGEDELGRIFGGVLSKRPRSVLDRIADAPYQTYGDDSTAVDDAPTSGKVYLKAEKHGNHLMWGNFKGGINHSAFLSTSRNLYGLQGSYGSPTTTASGERRFHVLGYAALPDSRPQRDELRGTGGSVYILKRRDLVPGSERLQVETVDLVTGRVLASRPLVAGQDYRIDYFQGTVSLTRPLSAAALSDGVISEGATGDHALNLVAQYEYVPLVTDPDGTALGGRVEAWLPGDTVRVGMTAMDEMTDTANLAAQSTDLRFQPTPESFIDVELAESAGTGFGHSISTDGGFTWKDVAPAGGSDRARAFRLGAKVALADIVPRADGRLTAWYEDIDAGFETLSENIAADQTVWGLAVGVQLTDRIGLSLGYEDFDSDDGNRHQTGEVALTYKSGVRTTVELGMKLRDEVRVGDPEDSGKRTDLGVKVIRELGFDQNVYTFAQTTVARSGGIRRNERLGFGGTFTLSPRLSAEAEASDGTSGLGARTLLTYHPDDAGRFYLGYSLDPDRSIAGTSLNGDHQGRWLLGAERQVSDSTRYFVEDSYDLFGERRALTQAYGVTYTPSSIWTFSANLERGRIVDSNDADNDYTALGVGTRYNDGNSVQGKARLEYRIETSLDSASDDRTTWAFLGSYSHQLRANWRIQADIDALFSDNDATSFPNGRYLEASLGYAWRPVEEDSWNLLAQYTYLHDRPGAEQIGADGAIASEEQSSHIMSLDAIFDPDAAWEFGGKLAYRMGETGSRNSDMVTSNDAGLLALRATYDFREIWQVTGETRFLWLPDADQARSGNLLTVYRDFGENLKLGVGYNFGEFSDDLRDTTLDDKGVFLNFQAKFSSL